MKLDVTLPFLSIKFHRFILSKCFFHMFYPIALLATGKLLISGLNTCTGSITGCLHPPLHPVTPVCFAQPSLAMHGLYTLFYWIISLKVLSWSSQTSWLQTTVTWNKIQLSSLFSVSGRPPSLFQLPRHKVSLPLPLVRSLPVSHFLTFSKG